MIKRRVKGFWTVKKTVKNGNVKYFLSTYNKVKRTAIKKKKCNCSPTCAKFPTIGCHGKNYYCLTDEEKQEIGTRRKVYLKKRRQINSIKRKLHKLTDEEKEKAAKLSLWYKARRYEMAGRCIECGAWTNKTDDVYYRWSVCHVVAKALLPSVALVPDNWIELCQQHHTDYDSTFEKASQMKCFAEAKRKFNLFRHLIPYEQLRKVNPYLLT